MVMCSKTKGKQRKLALILHKKSPNQCSGSGFIDFESGSSILGWKPTRVRFQIRIQSFEDQKLEKITVETKFDIFLTRNYNLLIPRPP